MTAIAVVTALSVAVVYGMWRLACWLDRDWEAWETEIGDNEQRRD